MARVSLRYPRDWAPADKPDPAFRGAPPAIPAPHVLFWPVIDCKVGFCDRTDPPVPVQLLLDSGASYCIFQSAIAEALGVDDVTAHGGYKRLSGLGGGEMDAWFHWVDVSVSDGTQIVQQKCYAGFVETPFTEDDDDDAFLGILGQYTFLDRVALTLDAPSQLIIIAS